MNQTHNGAPMYKRMLGRCGLGKPGRGVPPEIDPDQRYEDDKDAVDIQSRARRILHRLGQPPPRMSRATPRDMASPMKNPKLSSAVRHCGQFPVKGPPVRHDGMTHENTR